MLGMIKNNSPKNINLFFHHSLNEGKVLFENGGFHFLFFFLSILMPLLVVLM